MKCAFCGKEFFDPCRKAGRYCSDECSLKAVREEPNQQSTEDEEPKYKYARCAFCGEWFIQRHSKQKFCSDRCYSRYTHHRWNLRPKLEVNQDLVRWTAEARECNLDYGTYRALIESGKTFEELRAERDRHSTPAHAHCTYHYHK